MVSPGRSGERDDGDAARAKGRPMRILLAALLLLALIPAAEARNYKGDLVLNPADPVAGVENGLGGCGYAASTDLDLYVLLYLDVETATYTEIELVTDPSGCFSSTWVPVSTGATGWYEIWAIQPNKAGNGYQVKSKIVFTVD